MRNAFAAELLEVSRTRDDVVMLSGDIGNRLFDKFKAERPDRFYNCGVAEANMISVAAGLALCGLRPIAYTINAFLTTRCYEQIRVDLCHHRLPVVLVGVGAGLSYAELGGTHQSCEDIGILRVLPHMTVVCPADSTEVRLALRAALSHDGPVFIRLGKKGEPAVHEQPPDFTIGKPIVLREGAGVCLLGVGTILPVVLAAAAELEGRGVSCRVVSFHTVKPLDEVFLADVFRRFQAVVTVEEHSRIGGLGGAVAEWLADQAEAEARLVRIGAPDDFFDEAGSQSDARKKFGLTPQGIAETCLRALRGKGRKL